MFTKSSTEGRGPQQTPGTWVPPGHFYSPIPDLAAVRRRADTIFNHRGVEIPGIDLHIEQQLGMAQELRKSYRPDLFSEHPSPTRRYGWRNNFFPFADAFYLNRFLWDVGPRRVIEVGSGWSSAVLLDTCDDLRAAGRQPPRLDFIEPYPERLQGLLRPGDEQISRLHQSEVQDVPLAFFGELEAGDLLFIDSSHVIKTGSDLAWLFFSVLPRLKPGTWIFVHDIPWPFEYPREWVEEGRAWNEIYLLRAFLQYNDTFQVRWLPGLALGLHVERARAEVPLLVEQGGTGIWLERVK